MNIDLWSEDWIAYGLTYGYTYFANFRPDRQEMFRISMSMYGAIWRGVPKGASLGDNGYFDRVQIVRYKSGIFQPWV